MRSQQRKFKKAVLIMSTFLANPVLFSLTAQAAEENRKTEPPFSVELKVGAEYDSNIAITEIDSTSGEDDIATVFHANLGYDKNFTEHTELSLNYNFSQSLHNEFSQFDIQSHLLTTNLSHDFGNFNAGISYRLADSSLDGIDFLSLQQTSPYYSRFIGDKFFTRAHYTYTEKSFDSRRTRDSIVNAIGADIYYFVNGTSSYLVAAYQYEDEKSNTVQFDFESHNIKLRYRKRIVIGSNRVLLNLGYNFEDRNYSSITPSIGEKRNDERHSLEADFELELSAHTALLIEYKHGDNNSDLPSVDYSQNLFGIKLIFRL